jgi:hypothetical protein
MHKKGIKNAPDKHPTLMNCIIGRREAALTSPVTVRHVRESPHVGKADRVAEQRQEEIKLPRPVSSLHWFINAVHILVGQRDSAGWAEISGLLSKSRINAIGERIALTK